MPVRADLLWPAGAALLAIATAILGAPALVVGTLVVVCLAAAAERLTGRRGRGIADQIVVGVGGIVVLLIVVGVALAASPIGLSTRTWGVSLGAAALLGLAATARQQPQASRLVTTGQVSESLRVLPWLAASLVVVGAAFSSASASAEPTTPPRTAANTPSTGPSASGTLSELSTTPGSPVQMSLGQSSSSDVEILVTSAVASGPLELRVELGSTQISYPVFYVQPGTTATTRVQLPPTGRYVVWLIHAESGERLGSLVVTR